MDQDNPDLLSDDDSRPFDTDLNHSRFRINPESRNLLLKFKEELSSIKDKHPEIISAVFFGSHVVSQANKNSDVDSIIFIDETKVKGIQPISSGRVTPDSNDSNYQFYRQTFDSIRESLSQNLELAPEKTEDVSFCLISKARIDNELNGLVQYLRDSNAYEKKHDRVNPEDYHHSLDFLFLIQAGRDLDPYRAYILRKLEQESDVAEQAWKEISSGLYFWERKRIGHLVDEYDKNLWPQSINQAIKIFGLEHTPPAFAAEKPHRPRPNL